MGQKLKALVGDSYSLEDYPTIMPLDVLQTILDNIRERNQFTGRLFRRVRSVSFSPDGQHFVTAGIDGTASLWNLSGQEIAKWKSHRGAVWQASFSPDGQRIATSGLYGIVRIWNLSGQQIDEFKGHQGSVWSVSFSPNGQLLATVGEDGTARIWNILKHQHSQWDTAHRQAKSVSFSPDGQCIATVGHDGMLRLWELSGQQLNQWKADPDWVISVNFSPDGQQLVTVSRVGRAKLWNLSGQHIERFNVRKNLVRNVNFNPNGLHFATSTLNGTVRIWNLSRQQLARLSGHQGTVYSVRFSSNGQLVATVGEDGTTRIWDLSQKQLAKGKADQSSDRSVSFSPDDHCLAAAGEEDTVRLPRERLDELLSRGCDWLKQYLTTHPEALEKLDVCQNQMQSMKISGNPTRVDDLEEAMFASPLSAPVILTSARAIDYTRLHDLLKAGRNFSKRVGGDDGSNSWLYYSDLSFNLMAPIGHLPGGMLNWLWSSYREVARLGASVESNNDDLAPHVPGGIFSLLSPQRLKNVTTISPIKNCYECCI